MPGKPYRFKQTTQGDAGHDQHAPLPGRRQHAAPQGRADAGAERDRPLPRSRSASRSASTATAAIAATGAFILIDRLTNSTVGAGMILDRSTGDGRHDHWDDEPAAPAPARRAEQRHAATSAQARFGQKPVTMLLTGLTGAGKTTIAYALERRLFDEGRAVVVLDGQNMRRGISRDLGFTADDRCENLRRSAEVAKLMNDAGSSAGRVRRARRSGAPEGRRRRSAASGSSSSISTARSKSAASATRKGTTPRPTAAKSRISRHIRPLRTAGRSGPGAEDRQAERSGVRREGGGTG